MTSPYGNSSPAQLPHHLRRNAVAYLALFVALGGTSYAAVTLPRASIGARQLKNHAIEPIKLDPRFITGNVRGWAVVDSSGRVVAGGGKPEGGPTPTPGTYELTWGVRLRHGCATEATVDGDHSPVTEHVRIPGGASAAFTAGYAVADSSTSGKGRHHNVSFVDTFDQRGRVAPLGFDLAVIC